MRAGRHRSLISSSKKQVPATFFIVGENALTQRGLLERMIREGHEVGSHTYTHPNIATISKTQTLFELNATQTAVPAFTGRTLKPSAHRFLAMRSRVRPMKSRRCWKRKTAATSRSACTSTARIGSGPAFQPSSTTC